MSGYPGAYPRQGDGVRVSEPDTLFREFLLKVELLRLTEIAQETGIGNSRAEFMLMKENEILRSRLTTLKDNIGILTKMIDQMRTGAVSGSHVRSVGLCLNLEISYQ